MPDRRNIFLYYKKNQEMIEKVKPFYEYIDHYGFNIVQDHRKANIIMSFGGDGTFLQAVRKTGFREDCLYTGVSTGKLNVYCDFQIDEIASMVEAVKNEETEVRRYPTIDVTVDDQMSFQCLNEFSIRSSIIKTFVMDVFIDDLHFETFRGDGMVVSTPSGSTAYSKSINGAIVDPLVPSIQVSELASLNNNQYRTLGSPFILSGGRQLTLRILQDGNDHPTMGMDNEALSIQHVEKINIKLSDKQIKTVKLKNNSFWEKVKRTFL
ncbi:NAD kinase [Bacillus dakarensis]|uniref:NAD kinase n=1 Tax=Robertmurraya dakarensis TaxID=1926278 RepID=UPI000980B042|nr:NAD kinase [Bacillus dakarensis]